MKNLTIKMAQSECIVCKKIVEPIEKRIFLKKSYIYTDDIIYVQHAECINLIQEFLRCLYIKEENLQSLISIEEKIKNLENKELEIKKEKELLQLQFIKISDEIDINNGLYRHQFYFEKSNLIDLSNLKIDVLEEEIEAIKQIRIDLWQEEEAAYEEWELENCDREGNYIRYE